MPWFHWKKRMANEFARSQSTGLSWQQTFITETFELLTKKLCKVWFVISEYSVRDCMFTWKSEFKSLNCCIYWTTSVILIKFAGNVAWILTCKRCKLGEKICYNSRDIEFFLGVYFFWRALYISKAPLVTILNINILQCYRSEWSRGGSSPKILGGGGIAPSAPSSPSPFSPTEKNTNFVGIIEVYH